MFGCVVLVPVGLRSTSERKDGTGRRYVLVPSLCVFNILDVMHSQNTTDSTGTIRNLHSYR